MAHSIKYVLRFCFDPGSGCCFWSANDAARATYDYPVDAEQLPLSQNTRRQIAHLVCWYDTSIDWANPAGPSPWSADEFARFDAAVRKLLETVLAELGPDYQIVNEFSPAWSHAPSHPNCEVSPMVEQDQDRVLEIYRQGISTGNATFETQLPDWATWDSRHLPTCRLMARMEGTTVGWAALSPVSSRECYSGVAEVSVYVDASARGAGVGKALLQALVQDSERAGFWTLQAGIFPENTASIAIHQACGFRELGRRERIGQLHGVWQDTVIMERRSRVVGGKQLDEKTAPC